MRVFLPHRESSHERTNNHHSSNNNNNNENDNSHHDNVFSYQDSKRKQSQFEFEFVDERKIAAKKQRVIGSHHDSSAKGEVSSAVSPATTFPTPRVSLSSSRQHASSSHSESPQKSMGGGGKLFPVRSDRERLEVQSRAGDAAPSSVASAVARRGRHHDDDSSRSSDESSRDDDSETERLAQRQNPPSRADNFQLRSFQGGPFKNESEQEPKQADKNTEHGHILPSPSVAHAAGTSTTTPSIDPATISKNDRRVPIHKYAHLLRTQHVPSLEITPMAGDGNCLFRAVSLQVYGSEDMHALVRSQCLDFMEKEEEHFRDFVAEAYDEYLRRKRCPGVHGNHAEIQAMSELYNRKIEVYVPPGLVPMNIFQQDDRNEGAAENEESNKNHNNDNSSDNNNNNPPIRLLYMDGNHYDALIDPLVPTAGLGLGLPGLQPGLADRLQLDRAKEESHRIMQENMERKMQLALEESKRVYVEKEEGEMERVLRESCLGVGSAYRSEREEVEEAFQKKALYLSEMEAADFDLEQAVLASSLESYRKAEQERKQPSSSSGRRSESVGRRGRYNCSPNGGLSRSHRSCSSSPVHRTAAAASSTTEPISYAASFSASPSYYPSSYPHSAAVATSAAASSVASFPRARSSSPPNNYDETYFGVNVAASSLASTHTSSDEYPSSVQELVMNGFELSKVLHAYDLIGDNFDDLLSFLLSSTS